MRVLVTGAAGLVGAALMRALKDEPDLDEVGLDLSWSKRHDVERGVVRDEILREKPDVVIHLVARVDPPRGPGGRARMRKLHEEGTRNVASAARDLGARFCLMSSAVVYGARADNPMLSTEERPLSPNHAFPYAVDKATQERVAARVFSGAQRELTVFRPAIIYGSGVKNYLSEILRRSPVVPRLDNKSPRLQFVHVDDLAAAVIHALRSRLAGAYNVASAGTVGLEDVARVFGRRTLRVSSRLIAPVLDAGARFVPGHLRAPSYILPYLSEGFCVDTTKLAATGWTPRFTSRDALETLKM